MFKREAINVLGTQTFYGSICTYSNMYTYNLNVIFSTLNSPVASNPA